MKSAEQHHNVVQLRRPDTVSRRSQLEFLPAALEIMETPASPLGRSIAFTIMLFSRHRPRLVRSWTYRHRRCGIRKGRADRAHQDRPTA